MTEIETFILAGNFPGLLGELVPPHLNDRDPIAVNARTTTPDHSLLDAGFTSSTMDRSEETIGRKVFY
jgi:hypothetical protein